jgi:peptide/nickel transport system permease protein
MADPDPVVLEPVRWAGGTTEPPPEQEAGLEEEVVSRGRLIFRRFLRRKAAVGGFIVLVGLFILAFAGPHLTKWNYLDQDLSNALQGPSTLHWFGTTQLGQDVFARTMKGLQKSLVIGLLTAFFSTGTAAIVGSCAGYFGGWVDRILMWFVDLLLVLPSFLIIAMLSPQFKGKTWLLFVVLLAAFSWMITARIVRGLTLSLREREFIQAARFMGVPSRKIIFRHLLPNMSSFLIIDATLNVGGAILAESGLSYFGFGVQPPDVSLGTLIQEGTPFALTYPWIFLFAGLLLIATVLAVNVMGDGLRDALDPYSSAAKARTQAK